MAANATSLLTADAESSAGDEAPPYSTATSQLPDAMDLSTETNQRAPSRHDHDHDEAPVLPPPPYEREEELEEQGL